MKTCDGHGVRRAWSSGECRFTDVLSRNHFAMKTRFKILIIVAIVIGAILLIELGTG